MNYIRFAIKTDYNVYVQEDRFLEFSQNYLLDKTTTQQAKHMYLYDCIQAGWVKRTPQ
jgi:hypothetical protein